MRLLIPFFYGVNALLRSFLFVLMLYLHPVLTV